MDLKLTPSGEEIPGHFWIVRDNKIVDWDYPEYQELRDFHNCENKPKYRLESKENRRLAKKKWILEKRKALLEIKETMPPVWDELVSQFPMAGYCNLNVCIEQILRGGQIAFGDMGWVSKDTGDVWYEYEYKDNNYTSGKDIQQIFRNIKAGRKCPSKYGIPRDLCRKIKQGKCDWMLEGGVERAKNPKYPSHPYHFGRHTRILEGLCQ